MKFNWENIEDLQDAFPVLINNTFLSDVKFCFPDDSIIFAHSFILSLRSEEFYQHFKDSVGEKKIQVIDTSYHIFMKFLEYLYTDDENIIEENAVNLLKLSIKYNVLTLESKCREILQNKMCESNVVKIFEISTENSFDHFEIICEEFIAQNYLATLQHESFLQTNTQILNKILKLDPVLL